MDYNKTEKTVVYGNDEMSRSAAFPALMRKVYLWMTMALAITALTAYGVATSPQLALAVLGNKILFFGLLIAQLGLVVWMSARLNSMSLTKATLLFILYSVMMGATLSVIFFAYSPAVITKTFLVTAGTFGATAFFGYVTKANLSDLGRFCFMGLIGIIIATIVNFFTKSSMMDMVICYLGVAIFVGLTAWDSQKIKTALMYAPNLSEGYQKIALMGALSLYLDFINLFLYLLRIFGSSRD